MKELKSIRIRKSLDDTVGVLDLKISIFDDGSDFILTGINNGNTIWHTRYKKSGVYKDFTNDDFIKNFITLQSKINNSTYNIIQDPWEEKVPKHRNYGFDPYYLNNGSTISISWTSGTTVMGGKKYSDIDGNEIDVDTTITKYARIMNYESNKIIDIESDGSFKYPKDIKKDKKYSSTVKDIEIVNEIISKWNSMIPGYNLEICNPGNISCNLVKFKNPLDIKEDMVVPNTIKEGKIKPIVILPNDKLKVRFDFSIKVSLSNKTSINKETDNYIFSDDNNMEIDPEYLENSFIGEEESPFNIPEADLSFNNIEQESIQNYHESSGTVVSLSSKYSHTTTQGFNILNSKWIGSLVKSAISHIGTPTYDISGTDGGNLGCAAAVSLIFYRAFGVSIKTGSIISGNPNKLSQIGSLGTTELGQYFLNFSLYLKVNNWKNAQPGDILNTTRGSKAGHIGIVIDTKNSDGSWNVVSNSSKGFAGGGGGAIKRNYSIDKWNDVASRNPTRTFAYRYIGPKQQSNNIT